MYVNTEDKNCKCYRDVSHGKTSYEAKKSQCHGYKYIGNNNMMVHVHGTEGGKKEVFVMIVTLYILVVMLNVNVPHKSQYN